MGRLHLSDMIAIFEQTKRSLSRDSAAVGDTCCDSSDMKTIFDRSRLIHRTGDAACVSFPGNISYDTTIPDRSAGLACNAANVDAGVHADLI